MGPGASAAPSQLLLYIQRTLDSPPGRLRRADDVYHLSKLDTATGASCILPSVTSGEGGKSSWPPPAEPYVAPRLQGSRGRFLFFFFGPPLFPLLRVCRSSSPQWPLFTASLEKTVGPRPLSCAVGGPKTGPEKVAPRGRRRKVAEGDDPVRPVGGGALPSFSRRPAEAAVDERRNAEHRCAGGRRKSVCDRK